MSGRPPWLHRCRQSKQAIHYWIKTELKRCFKLTFSSRVPFRCLPVFESTWLLYWSTKHWVLRQLELQSKIPRTAAHDKSTHKRGYSAHIRSNNLQFPGQNNESRIVQPIRRSVRSRLVGRPPGGAEPTRNDSKQLEAIQLNHIFEEHWNESLDFHSRSCTPPPTCFRTMGWRHQFVNRDEVTSFN